MIHRLKLDLEAPNGFKQQLDLEDTHRGCNGSVQVRFDAGHGFSISCLGRQTTVILHRGDQQVALSMDELDDLFSKVFPRKS